MKIFTEVLFVIGMFALLLIPSAMCGQWWLFFTFLIFGIIFGFFEWFAKHKTGRTVSQHFWAFSLKNKTKAWVILGCMALAWILLLGHLAIKMIK